MLVTCLLAPGQRMNHKEWKLVLEKQDADDVVTDDESYEAEVNIADRDIPCQ